MEIPYEQLSSKTLHALIEEFVTREGTDYGLQEYSLEEKIEQVRSQLKSESASIVFDPKTETCNIIMHVL